MSKSRDDRKQVGPSPIRYIPCEVEPGMFRGELLAYIQGLDPEQPGERIRVQLLVDQSEVKGLRGEPKRNKPATGWLRVTLANQTKGVGVVILPQPAQPVGESMLVDINELRKEAGT